MKPGLRSIRWRVQIWHGVILAIALLGLCAAVHRLAWHNELRRIDRELVDRERNVMFALGQSIRQESGASGAPPTIFARLREGNVTVPALIAERYQGHQPGYAYFTFRDRDGRVLLQSPNSSGAQEALPFPERGLAEEYRFVGRVREMRRSSEFGMATIFGRDISPELEQRYRFAWSLGAVAAAVWTVGLIGGWWIAGRAIRPVEKISETAQRIADGRLDDRINTSGAAAELAQLGQVLNRTFDRLQETFERERQFTADAAHELRTPITILTTETQRMLKRPRTAEEYRSSLETCAETVLRMRRLVEDLLLLARHDAAPAAHEPVDLAEIAGQVVRQLEPVAQEARVSITTELGAATCSGQVSGLFTVTNNLVMNAIQHHHASGGHVWVSTRTNGSMVELSVRDDGPGVSDADLPHLFDRFYRVDKARGANGVQHSGLGLAIVQSIVRAVGGKVECQSMVGKGTTFTVSIPALASPTT